jgi:hypothetical protein
MINYETIKEKTEKELSIIIKEKDKNIKSLEKKINKLAYKVFFADETLRHKEDIPLEELVMFLTFENEGKNDEYFYDLFVDNGIIYENGNPTKKFMKYFKLVDNILNTPFGKKSISTTMVTPEGQMYFSYKVKKLKLYREYRNDDAND